MSLTLQDVMTPHPLTAKMDQRLVEVVHLFESQGIHHLPVVEHQRVVGLVSERDLLRSISPFIGRPNEQRRDRATLHRRVHQIMDREPLTAGSDMSLCEASMLMWGRARSCLIVVDPRGRPLGIVTAADLLLRVCDIEEAAAV